jgi:microtubule-associated protein, RP/EB family
MMTGAYFVGRRELLQWLNTLLSLNYKKVEECSSGAAYCQIFDAMAPNKVNMKKVNFQAASYQYVENFKELQNSFKRLGITKVIDVVALTRGSYQDNLEFLQWIKAYYEQNVPQNLEYDAVARRGGKPHSATASVAVSAPPAASAPSTVEKPRRTTASKPVASKAEKKESKREGEKKREVEPSATTTTTSAKSQPLRNAVNTGNNSRTRSSSKPDQAMTALSSELTDLNKKYSALQLKLDRAEQERDFYFSKLRDVEIWSQTHPDPKNACVLEVQSILYAVDE